ncbi:MAG TPA: hypothetical protein PLL75_00550 [Candidatus Omnitrophota bacterium]|nr:hypothetical protein [Candidatus Omnitrophota bacterium]HPS36204.1 hypothetical protein [Candidatus Omnitrophota bacterium]
MIKGLFQLVFGVVRLAFFLVIFLIIFHAWAIKQAIKFSLSYQLAADVAIQEVKMDWKNSGFEVRGLEIGNPYSFPKGVLADIPLTIVSLDVPSLMQGRGLRLKTLGFNIKELQVMNVPQKGLSLLALKPLQGDNEESEAGSSAKAAVKQQMQKFSPRLVIDELIFSLGEITYISMNGPTMQQNRFRAGIRGATYYNIRGTEDIAVIVVGEALKKMGFGYLEAQLQNLQGRSFVSKGQSNNFLNKAFSALKSVVSE